MTDTETIQTVLDDFLETARQKRGLPSISAAAALGKEVFWHKACGLADLESARSAHPEMVYPLGSISKVFVVTMLMQLVEQGVVALEDPITKYIPEYQVISPFPGAAPASSRSGQARPTAPARSFPGGQAQQAAPARSFPGGQAQQAAPARSFPGGQAQQAAPATLRQLAAHTAGLPRDAAINFPMNQSLGDWEFSAGQAPLCWYASAEEVLASLPTVVLELPPDTAKHYSNLGIMLLGIALERACGQKLSEYISRHIFAPLGMNSAGFLDEERAWDERFPTGYGRSVQSGGLFAAPPWQLGGAMYTGGIYATAADLARFCTAFLPDNPGGAFHSPILRAGSIRRMIHPEAMGDTTLGWWKGWHAGYSNYGHSGAHVGFISAALFIPELQLSVAVQTNRWNPIFDTNDSTEVARELLARLIPHAEQNRPAFDPAGVDLNRYAGRYALPGAYAAAEVTAQNGLLGISMQGASEMFFAPLGPGRFGPPGTSFPAVTFEEDEEGRPASFTYALFCFQKQGI